MAKKIIIIVLILLILISLGIIGYIVLSQNGSSGLTRLWPFGTGTKVATVPNNAFPVGTTTSNTGFANNSANNSNQPVENNPVGGQTAGDNPTLAGVSAIGLTLIGETKTEKVLFVDRPSGNIFEINAKNELSRLTGETLNGIQDVFWGRDKSGDRIITKFFQFNQSMSLLGLIKAATSTELGSLKNQALGMDIGAIAVSPDKTKFFTLEPSSTGVIGYINDWTGKGKKKIWSFPYGDWQASWPKDSIISLTTTPSANDAGYFYFLNPSTGSLTKILGEINGLTASASPDGDKVIFSRSGLGGLNLFLYEHGAKKTSPAGVNTLPEKCLWQDSNTLYCAVPRNIPSGRYPDNWYQGKIAFSDDIWKIDLKQKTTTLVIPIKGSYDLTNLVIAPKRGWLYAINKGDSSIQSFSLPL